MFHKRNITSSQVTTHLKNYLGEQNNRRATEEENGWNPPFYRIPSPTHEEDTFTQKDAGGACATSVDAGGASDPLPQQTGTSNPFPQKDAGGATSVDAGGASDPFPQQTGTSNPFPLPPPPYIKG